MRRIVLPITYYLLPITQSVMNKVDKFFNSEKAAIALEGNAIAHRAARELQADILRQIRRNFSNPSIAFQKGVKVYDFDDASVVRLASPILSSFVEDAHIEGNPNLWILLPDGARLGFKRIGKSFNWSDLKRNYGTRLSFVKVSGGSVVLYRTRSGEIKPIYKLQESVDREQKIEFYESAERIGNKYNLTVRSND